jgi:hypothetical protein
MVSLGNNRWIALLTLPCAVVLAQIVHHQYAQTTLNSSSANESPAVLLRDDALFINYFSQPMKQQHNTNTISMFITSANFID